MFAAIATIVPDAAAVRRGLLAGRRGEPVVRVRPARRGRHEVRHDADVRAGVAADGDPDRADGVARRERLLVLGVRDRCTSSAWRLLLVPVPRREVEVDAGDRTAGRRGRRRRHGLTAEATEAQRTHEVCNPFIRDLSSLSSSVRSVSSALTYFFAFSSFRCASADVPHVVADLVLLHRGREVFERLLRVALALVVERDVQVRVEPRFLQRLRPSASRSRPRRARPAA